MAKKANSSASAISEDETATAVEMPAGYDSVNPIDGQPWWLKVGKGVEVYAKLLGRYPRKGKNAKGYFYQCELETEALCVRGSGDDAEEEIREAGTIINMDERSALEGLRPLVADSNLYSIYLKWLEKISLPGGNSFWKVSLGSKVIGKKEARKEVDAPF